MMIVRLLASGLMTVVVKAGVELVGYSISWWLAAGISLSLVLVFGGCLIIVDGSWD